MPTAKRDVAWKLKVAATVAVLIVSGTAALRIVFGWLDIQTQALAAEQHIEIEAKCAQSDKAILDALTRIEKKLE